MIKGIHIDILTRYVKNRGWIGDHDNLLFSTYMGKLYVARQLIKNYELNKHNFGIKSKIMVSDDMLTRQMDYFILEHMRYVLTEYQDELKDVIVCFFNQKSDCITTVNVFNLFSSDKEQDKI